MEEQIMNMPAVALRGLTILPGMIAHFDISRERSLRAVEEAMEQDQKIYLVTQRNVDSEDPTQEDLYQMGIVADIKQVVRLQNDVVRILVDGISRAALLGFTGNEKYLEAEICYCDSNADSLPDDLREAMLLGVREAFHRYAAVVGKISKELIRQIDQYEDLEKLIDYVTNNLPVSYELKQQVLEAEDINDRYQVIVSLLLSQVEVISIKNELQKKVKVRVDKHQKEYVLREQLGVIREELGENADSEADEYEKKLSELDAPDYVKEKTKKEIKRFRNMSSSSSESTVERGYIETVLELPWNRMSVDNKDLDHAAQVLDDDHYGLKDVKERILEFLAVRNLTSKGESPIICLVGPPGTGKTSIARSIASALEKKYVRISLGGVRDEAEIRGHRKTYIGAMPGRIVNGLRQAGVSNPLMLLDEIDKVSSDYKGDTSAALLEVLDSEQNCRFRDQPVVVQQQPVEGAGQAHLFDLEAQGVEERPEIDGRHAQRHHGQHHREQGCAVFLAHLRQADTGRHQQNGRERQRPVPRLAVAQQVKGGKIVEGCSIHLDGNGDRLRHKNTLLFGHSTILFSNNQGRYCADALKCAKIGRKRKFMELSL